MIALAQAASQIAGRPVTVDCSRWLMDDESDAGYVLFRDDQVIPVIHLDKGLCALLRAPRTSPMDPSLPLAFLALQHEATHVALDSTDETLVECTAVANRWQLVKLFALPAKIARAVMRGEIAEDKTLDPTYHREACA